MTLGSFCQLRHVSKIDRHTKSVKCQNKSVTYYPNAVFQVLQFGVLSEICRICKKKFCWSLHHCSVLFINKSLIVLWCLCLLIAFEQETENFHFKTLFELFFTYDRFIKELKASIQEFSFNISDSQTFFQKLACNVWPTFRSL